MLQLNIVFNNNCSFYILKKLYKENENLKYLITKHPNWKFGEFE